MTQGGIIRHPSCSVRRQSEGTWSIKRAGLNERKLTLAHGILRTPLCSLTTGGRFHHGACKKCRNLVHKSGKHRSN